MRFATLGTQVNFSTAFFLQHTHTPLPTPFTPNSRTRTTPMAGTFDPNQAQNLVEVPRNFRPRFLPLSTTYLFFPCRPPARVAD